jgi:hypothetical protein
MAQGDLNASYNRDPEVDLYTTFRDWMEKENTKKSSNGELSKSTFRGSTYVN